MNEATDPSGAGELCAIDLKALSDYMWECYDESLYAVPRSPHWWPLGEEPPETLERMVPECY